MGFLDRSSKSDKLIALMSKHFWESELMSQYRINHESCGYETSFSSKAQNALKRDDSLTAKYIRFTPDYLVWQTRPRDNIKSILMEYKATTTPRFTYKDNQWNAGQIEADAWENYLRIQSNGAKVALMIYCSYHHRPLLCDFPSEDWVILDRRDVQSSDKGSKTPYTNIDLSKMRSFGEFMWQEFGVDHASSDPIIHKILHEALNDRGLQTNHDYRSQFKHCETGFNWPHLKDQDINANNFSHSMQHQEPVEDIPLIYLNHFSSVASPFVQVDKNHP